uniref:Uncharacterized protein n=1 Tax=Cucumis melo TaxID=3656 RepID=A0A9I9EKX0_CUCME
MTQIHVIEPMDLERILLKASQLDRIEASTTRPRLKFRPPSNSIEASNHPTKIEALDPPQIPQIKSNHIASNQHKYNINTSSTLRLIFCLPRVCRLSSYRPIVSRLAIFNLSSELSQESSLLQLQKNSSLIFIIIESLIASCIIVYDAFGLEVKSGKMCLQSKQIALVRCFRIVKQQEVPSYNGSLDTDQDVSNSAFEL